MPRVRHSAKWIHQETSRHGKRTYVFRRGDGRRYRLPDDYGSEDFWKAYRHALEGGDPPIYERPPSKRMAEIDECLRKAFYRARGKSEARGLPFDLTIEWAQRVVAAQGYRCALTGIPFLTESPGKSQMRPYAPSFDRIVPGGGYTQENVRIVVFAVNAMLADWGPEVMERVTGGYRFRKNNRRTSIPAPVVPAPRTFEPDEGTSTT